MRTARSAAESTANAATAAAEREIQHRGGQQAEPEGGRADRSRPFAESRAGGARDPRSAVHAWALQQGERWTCTCRSKVPPGRLIWISRSTDPGLRWISTWRSHRPPARARDRRITFDGLSRQRHCCRPRHDRHADDPTSVFVLSIQLASVPTPSSTDPDLIHAIDLVRGPASGGVCAGTAVSGKSKSAARRDSQTPLLMMAFAIRFKSPVRSDASVQVTLMAKECSSVKRVLFSEFLALH